MAELPSIDLKLGENGQYKGCHDDFHTTGTYQIVIYASDRVGNISVPKLTQVNVENPLRRRAIIVAGASQSDAL